MSHRLLFVVNDANFFLSHRLAVAKAAQDAGYEVHVATAPSPNVADFDNHGLVHHAVPISRSGRNPFDEFRSFFALLELMRNLSPQLVHLVTVKPVLYGGIAARLAGVPSVVFAISGLGYLFSTKSLRARLQKYAALILYKVALGHKNQKIIFQNAEDKDALCGFVRLADGSAVIVHGSGVDLNTYACLPEPEPLLTVTFASRLIKPKGVAEFVAAAKHLRRRGHYARFWLVGGVDQENPTTVTEVDLARWQSEGAVQILGHRTDIADLFAASNIVVLPSYYGEGVPKVLLEAAACGRAIVTTDHPGCRDAIEDGVTGLLVPIQDEVKLATAIERLLIDSNLRRAMGIAGRKKAEREFSIESVVTEHLRIYQTLQSGHTVERGDAGG